MNKKPENSDSVSTNTKYLTLLGEYARQFFPDPHAVPYTDHPYPIIHPHLEFDFSIDSHVAKEVILNTLHEIMDTWSKLVKAEIQFSKGNKASDLYCPHPEHSALDTNTLRLRRYFNKNGQHYSSRILVELNDFPQRFQSSYTQIQSLAENSHFRPRSFMCARSDNPEGMEYLENHFMSAKNQNNGAYEFTAEKERFLWKEKSDQTDDPYIHTKEGSTNMSQHLFYDIVTVTDEQTGNREKMYNLEVETSINVEELKKGILLSQLLITGLRTFNVKIHTQGKVGHILSAYSA